MEAGEAVDVQAPILVALVDDDPGICRILSRALRPAFRVLTAETGAEALRLLDRPRACKVTWL